MGRALGVLAHTPMSHLQAALQADATAALAVPCWGMFLLSAGIIGRRLLDVRRLAAWDDDWRAMDPRGPAGANPGPSPARRCAQPGAQPSAAAACGRAVPKTGSGQLPG